MDSRFFDVMMDFVRDGSVSSITDFEQKDLVVPVKIETAEALNEVVQDVNFFIEREVYRVDRLRRPWEEEV